MRQRPPRWIQTIWSIGLLSMGLLISAPTTSCATWVAEGRGGIQYQKFSWTIAGPGGVPNVLSELTFKSSAPKGELNLRWLSEQESFFIDTTVGYATQTWGSVRDDDFAQNDRQGLFSRSQSTIGGNSIQNYHFQGGWRVIKTDRLALAVTGGYRYDFYSFRIQPPATQVVPAVPVNFDSLNSMYNARWSTFTVGLELLAPLRPLPVAFQLKSHVWPNVTYTGKGFWNMRQDDPSTGTIGFKQDPSYKHKANGNGLDLDLSFLFRWSEHWQSTIGWQMMWMKVKDGTDQTFFTDGSSPVIPFKTADLRTNYYYLGMGYRW